jgi:hypothetical protein
LHRAQIAGVVELRGVNRTRKIYEEARRDLEARLDALVRSGRGSTFQATHYRFILAQVYQALQSFGVKFRRHLEDTGSMAGELGASHVVDEVRRFETHFAGHTPVLQTAQIGVLRRVHAGVLPSLLTRYRKSMELYGKPTVEAIHRELAVSLASGEQLDQAAARVAGTSGAFANQLWRAERISRTELSYSYNVTKHEEMREMQAVDVPDLRKTMISTFDDRTAKMSHEQHMQVKRVDEDFEWHVLDSKGNRTGEVRYYSAPPAIPNDRAVLVPWREGWGPRNLGGPPVEPRLPSIAR